MFKFTHALLLIRDDVSVFLKPQRKHLSDWFIFKLSLFLKPESALFESSLKAFEY